MFIKKTFFVLILCTPLLSAAIAQAEENQALTPLQSQIIQAEQESPKKTLALIRESLTKPNLSIKEKLWLRSRLANSLQRDRQFNEALRVAHQAQIEAQAIPLERVHFGALATMILHDARRDLDAKVEFEKIASTLQTLVDTKAPRRTKIEAAQAWLIGGTVMSALGQTPEAMDLLTKARRLYDELNDLIIEQADCINEIAFIHYKLGQVDTALREEQRAIDLLESNNLRDSLSR